MKSASSVGGTCPRSHFLASTTLVLGSALVFGCTSMPDHSNLLIFGSTTKLAIDVSPDPSGSVGATIGYRRQEVVLMPLLANQGAAGAKTPATCAGKPEDCPMFVGTESSGAARDTYSVFASFGAQPSAAADAAATPRVGATIAQYFATGFAARSLALRGNAALVNTTAASEPWSTTLEVPEADGLRLAKINAVVEKAKVSGAFDATRWQSLVDRSSQRLPAAYRGTLRSLTTEQEVAVALKMVPSQSSIVDALLISTP
jgi:hypothetical protein